MTKITNKNFPELPNSFIFEEKLLNLLLIQPDFFEDMFSSYLKADLFYNEAHKIIYKSCMELIETKEPITFSFLVEKLQTKNLLDQIGGIKKITNLFQPAETLESFYPLVKNLNGLYERRILVTLGKELMNSASNPTENVSFLLEKINQKVVQINQENLEGKIFSAAEIVEDIYSEMKLKITTKETNGFQSSFKELDSILQGFQKSDLIIIAGRPSMGKTAFSLNLGKNIVEKYNIPLFIFSLEMSRQQIMYRFLSSESNIASNRLKSGKMTQNEWKALSEAMTKISKLPIFIDDNPTIRISDIKSKLKSFLNTQNQNGVLIIDYLQLMKPSLKIENRTQEISNITRNLKILAKEFNIPILLLSQLSRSVESRTNKRPMLSDLRESGCLGNSNFESNIQSWKKESFYTLLPNNVISNNFKGLKPSFLITLTNGKNLLITANHKIFNQTGWISISQLRKNNFVLSSFLQKKRTNFQYFPIQKIGYSGLENVYDQSIPYFHNYFYQNTLLHNSIEQDADVVIMLYREEYYKEKSFSQQLTEIIVAKHRNGSIGTATLTFNPMTTTFKNK